MTQLYYGIRHKATGELMPEVRRRGYSHWNPATGKLPDTIIGTPRLLPSHRMAHRCIVQWAAMPNAKMTYAWDDEDEIDIKPDGRKKEDLEVVELELRIL
jgi:hypothetical protein